MGPHWVLTLLYLQNVLYWPEDGRLRSKHVAIMWPECIYNITVLIYNSCVLTEYNLFILQGVQCFHISLCPFHKYIIIFLQLNHKSHTTVCNQVCVIYLFCRLYNVSTFSCAHLKMILSSSSSCLCHSSLPPLTPFLPTSSKKTKLLKISLETLWIDASYDDIG